MATITTICADLPTLYRHLLDLTDTSLQAIRYTHAHTTGTQADSLPERATYARERLERELGELRQIAGILADTDHGQTPIDKVAVVLAEHATTLAAWPDLLADIERIYARWKRAVAPDTEASNHLCPACGRANLNWAHARKVYLCPACDYAGTVRHVANLRDHVIRHSDVWVTRTQACGLFGLSAEALRWHIRQGHLQSKEGLLHTAELRALPRRDRG